MECLAECVDAAPTRRVIAYMAGDHTPGGCTASGFVSCVPRLQGARIVVSMRGCLKLQLSRDDAHADGGPALNFNCTVPSVTVALLPSLRTEFAGTWHLWCTATGLAVEVTHVTRSMLGIFTGGGSGGSGGSAITGRVLHFPRRERMPIAAWTAPHHGYGEVHRAACACSPAASANGATELGTLRGCMDGAITFTPTPVGPSAPAADACRAGVPVWRAEDIMRGEAAAGLTAATVDATSRSDPLPAELLWGHTAAALRRCAWDAARSHKHDVERLARAAARRGAPCAWLGACARDARAPAENGGTFVYSAAHGWQPNTV